MPVCFAPDCNHVRGKDVCSFHRFPKTPLRLRRWVKNIRRGDRLPNTNDLMCSCHFKSLSCTPTSFKRDRQYSHLFKSPVRYSRTKKRLLGPEQPDLLSPSPQKMPRFQDSTHTPGPSSPMEDEVLAVPFDDSTSTHDLSNEDTITGASVANEVTASVNNVLINQQTPRATNVTNPRMFVGYETPTTPQQSNEQVEQSLKVLRESHMKSVSEGKKFLRRLHDRLSDLTKAIQTLQTEKNVLLRDVADYKQEAFQHKNAWNESNADLLRLKGAFGPVCKALEQERQKIEEFEKVMADLNKEHAQCKDLHSLVALKEKELEAYSIKMCTALRANLDLSKSLTEERNRLLMEGISSSESKVCHYTGLASYKSFLWVLSLFENQTLKYHSFNVTCLSRENQLLMTLMRLRLGLKRQTLADWFRCSKTTVTNIVSTWISALHTVLFLGIMGEVPSLLKMQQSLPECFKPFPNCRMVLDCTEIPAYVPKSMRQHNLNFSNYKHRTTYKGCVGIAPNGTVVFASKMYPGSTSDKAVVNDSGIVKVFKPGESVMVDKGFLIGDMLPPGVTLIRPPFKSTVQFTVPQVIRSRQISKARVHVERAIERIKRYKILDFVPPSMAPHASKVFQVCCALTNLKPPLIADVADALGNGALSSDEDD